VLVNVLAVLVGTSALASQPSVLREPVPDRVVVLTFDDAVRSHATHVAPLLEHYGFGGTFFVTEFLDPPFADTTLYMTWEQIRSLNQKGFEIGNHTRNHTHVTRTTRAELAAELEYIEETGRKLGIPVPLSFAYPAYAVDPRALETLHGRGYLFARTGGSRAYEPEVDHPYLIPSFSTTGTDSERVLDAIRQARDGKIVVLTVHGVPDEAHPWVSTPPELFAEYLRYLSANQYTVLALRDLAKFVDIDLALEQITPDFGEAD
jgi:peptidoglycan-N-acetylglucosamine deacetylase